ncbi:c-type cytochrome [Helicobacter cappadocius]|uniref:C-type cytochrome n=1 Tax=Helicobacter cappadocius TaxID=3063998 RepID=A0AA90PU79_9HELI|nr:MULTISPECIES: c-type cytochrome [unclassified Helicobacter]MDO7253673.1 c-type cytochrome [Helicobacter sp. faydin-H75]MDP2539639.1 c-type cytochrome [Helicobacter sp. faydin-H76]
MKKSLLALTILALGAIGLQADPATIIKTKCQACHGANMEKSALGKSKIVNTLTPEKIKADLLGYKAGTLNQYKMGATMWGQAKSLSDADIDALAKYIPTLKK